MKKMKSFKSDDDFTESENNVSNDSVEAASAVKQSPASIIEAKPRATFGNTVKFGQSMPYSFKQSDYSLAVKKISDAFVFCNKDLALPQLNIPDTYLTCDFVRKEIFDQLNVRLTSAQINSLCYKLSSNSAEGKLGVDQEFLNLKKNLIMGAEIKSLIVRIGLLVNNKNSLL